MSGFLGNSPKNCRDSVRMMRIILKIPETFLRIPENSREDLIISEN
jgi:hypothetical protein